MANVERLQTDVERRERANEWLARLTAEDVTPEERARFEEWRQHPANARAHNEVTEVWNIVRNMGKSVQAYDMSQTLSESTQRAIRKAQAERTRGRRIGLAVAATLVGALCVGWWMNTRSPASEFQTAIGEHATVKLPDGSTLELNSNSQAKVFYTERVRIVRLGRGEAYFDVESDSQRPFWVSAGSSWVGAVGTAFNVDMRRTEVRVTVREGAVKVAANMDTALPPDPRRSGRPLALVKAGQQVNVKGASSEVLSLGAEKLSRSMAWRVGSLDFNNDRLADVVEELNRYLEARIIIEDSGLGDIKIGGLFETNSHGAESLLSMLEDGFGLEVLRDGRTVHISKRR